MAAREGGQFAPREGRAEAGQSPGSAARLGYRGLMMESALLAALVERGGPVAAAWLHSLVYGEELELPARPGFDLRVLTEAEAQAF